MTVVGGDSTLPISQKFIDLARRLLEGKKDAPVGGDSRLNESAQGEETAVCDACASAFGGLQ